MNILKFENGTVKILNEKGSVIKRIGDGDIIDSDIKQDGSRILTTTVGGKVELRNKSGSLIHTLGNREAVTAKFCGSYILITNKNGKKELRNSGGDLIFDLDSLSQFLKKSRIIESEKLKSRLLELPELKEHGQINDDEFDLISFILNYTLSEE